MFRNIMLHSSSLQKLVTELPQREREGELVQINCRYISLQDTISSLNTIILKNKVKLHIKIHLGQQGFSAENLHDVNHIFIKLNSILSP